MSLGCQYNRQDRNEIMLCWFLFNGRFRAYVDDAIRFDSHPKAPSNRNRADEDRDKVAERDRSWYVGRWNDACIWAQWFKYVTYMPIDIATYCSHMYIYIYILCVYIYIYTLFVFVYLYIYIYVCLYWYVYIYIYVTYLYIYM